MQAFALLRSSWYGQGPKTRMLLTFRKGDRFRGQIPRPKARNNLFIDDLYE